MKSYITFNIRAFASKEDKNVENLIIHCPWDEYAAQKAYEYARKVLKAPWPRGERVILKSAHYSYLYARHVLNSRWPKAEKRIAKSCEYAYLYAKYVIKGRFPEAEKNKSNTGFNRYYYREQFIYLYAKYILKTRWESMEDKMIKKDGEFYNTETLVNYAVNVMKHRWKRIETEVSRSRYIKKYAKILKPDELEEFHNLVMMQAMIEPKHSWEMNYAKQYIDSLKK